jgi:hypothetical protein
MNPYQDGLIGVMQNRNKNWQKQGARFQVKKYIFKLNNEVF